MRPKVPQTTAGVNFLSAPPTISIVGDLGFTPTSFRCFLRYFSSSDLWWSSLVIPLNGGSGWFVALGLVLLQLVLIVLVLLLVIRQVFLKVCFGSRLDLGYPAAQPQFVPPKLKTVVFKKVAQLGPRTNALRAQAPSRI